MPGIKETKELIVLLDQLVGVAVEGLKDGNISITDGIKFLQLLPSVKTALDGANQVKSELSELDEQEIRELADLTMGVCTKILKIFG
jgi:hypothetical protein